MGHLHQTLLVWVKKLQAGFPDHFPHPRRFHCRICPGGVRQLVKKTSCLTKPGCSDLVMHQVQVGTHNPSQWDAKLQHAWSAALHGTNRGVKAPLLSSWVAKPFPSFFMEPFSIIGFKGTTGMLQWALVMVLWRCAGTWWAGATFW